MSSRRISVIIPTKDRPEDASKCLDSILIQTLLPDEIIIVDGSSTNEFDSNIITRANEKIKTIYLHTTAGLTHQKNAGVRASSGDILFFLDDDVVLEKDFIKEILNVFAQDPNEKVAGVCGDIITPKEQNGWSARHMLIEAIQTLNKSIATIFLLSKNGNGKFRASGFPTDVYGAKEIKNVEFLPGGLTAYRRKIFAEFEFDENLSGYCYMEDDDFSYRVSRRYKNVFTPYAKLFHNVSPVARADTAAREKMLIENSYYLFKKNIPQTLKHKFAFYWAITGLCLSAILITITGRNMGLLKGFIAGLASITVRK